MTDWDRLSMCGEDSYVVDYRATGKKEIASNATFKSGILNFWHPACACMWTCSLWKVRSVESPPGADTTHSSPAILLHVTAVGGVV